MPTSNLLDAPDLNVRRIMQRRADGAPISDRDYKRLGQRQIAEEAVMRTGGAVNRSINPRAKTPFEQGTADRAYNDAYAAGRAPGTPFAPALPVAASASKPSATLATPSPAATPLPASTAPAPTAAASPVTRIAGRYNGANLDPTAKMAPGSGISIRGIDGQTKSWDGQKFVNPAIAPAATAPAMPAGAPAPTAPMAASPAGDTNASPFIPSQAAAAGIAASPDGDNEPAESPAAAADEGPDDLLSPAAKKKTAPMAVKKLRSGPFG